MKNKTRKEDFISDKRRISYLSAVHGRIRRGQSVLIEGGYGVGKTRFLKLIQPKKLNGIWVESLFNVHEILASVLRELNYEAIASYQKTPGHLTAICGLSNFFIVIDEANDLGPGVWPYLKRNIDADISIILAGLPRVRTFLTREYPDLLSRLKTLILFPIVVEDFILEYKNFEPEAIEQIYTAVKGDMRKFKEICTDCLDRAKELKASFVEVELALSFIEDLPSM